MKCMLGSIETRELTLKYRIFNILIIIIINGETLSDFVKGTLYQLISRDLIKESSALLRQRRLKKKMIEGTIIIINIKN